MNDVRADAAYDRPWLTNMPAKSHVATLTQTARAVACHQKGRADCRFEQRVGQQDSVLRAIGQSLLRVTAG